MYSFINPSVYGKPGNFELTDILLTSYRSGNNDNTPTKIDIKSLILEVNIYESIFNKTLSGNVVLADANNIISQYPLTGFERIEFKLRSPGISRLFDFSEKSGHPMYIYQVSDRNELSPRSQAYIIHFCSKEMLRNEQITVKKSYKDTISNIASSLLYEENNLDTQKKFFVEPSYGVHQYVFPQTLPFECIDLISKEARSLKYNNSGFYFFETADGFNFKSLENLLAITTEIGRPAMARFESIPANTRDQPMGQKDIGREMAIIQEFKVLSQFDTLKNLRNGVYGSHLITHNLLEKTFRDTKFDYFDDFSLSFHTELRRNGRAVVEQGITPFTKFYKNKFISQETGVFYVKSSTTQLHNDVEVPEQPQILQKRLSQRLAFESFRVQLKVHGFTGLSAGDIVTLILPSYGVSDKTDPKDQDPILSGRYIIASIRHSVNQIDKKHYMYLECLKDSVKIPFASEFIDTFTDREKSEKGLINQYIQDEADILNDTATNQIFKT
jgi:hypothetical protein